MGIVVWLGIRCSDGSSCDCEGSYAAEEVLVEIERRNSERDRRERLFWQNEAALVAIAQGHERPVELAIKTLMGG